MDTNLRPSQVTISNWQAANAGITGLTIGQYEFQLKVTDNDNASSAKKIKVLVKNKNGESVYFNIYPNPASVSLNIQYFEALTGKVKISIYDASNRLLKDAVINKDQVTLTETIDVHSMSSGLYFIQLISPGNQKIVKKFVKL